MNTSPRVSPISASSLSSSLPACPTNGRPCLSSLRAGRLADEHEVGVGVARPEDDGRAGRGELGAARAAPGLLEDGLERLAALLRRRRHGRDRYARRFGRLRAAPSGRPDHAHVATPTERDRHPATGGWTEIMDAARLAPSSVVGRPLGTALAAALRAAGRTVDGPARARDAARRPPGLVLLCVPDARDRRRRGGDRAARGLLVGHCSGATGLARSPRTRRSRCIRS